MGLFVIFRHILYVPGSVEPKTQGTAMNSNQTSNEQAVRMGRACWWMSLALAPIAIFMGLVADPVFLIIGVILPIIGRGIKYVLAGE